jgi:hypothetical protein
MNKRNKILVIVLSLVIIGLLIGLGIWFYRREKFLTLSAVNFAGYDKERILNAYGINDSTSLYGSTSLYDTDIINTYWYGMKDMTHQYGPDDGQKLEKYYPLPKSSIRMNVQCPDPLTTYECINLWDEDGNFIGSWIDGYGYQNIN